MVRSNRLRHLVRVMVCAVLSTVLVAALAAPANALTLFLDNFEDGNANGWTFTNGNWSVVAEESMVLRQASIFGDARAVATVTGRGSGPATIVFAGAKPRAWSANGSVVVLFTAADANNYFFAALRPNALQIGKRQGGVVTVLASTPYAPAVGTWHRMTIDLTIPGRISAVAAGTLPGAIVTVTGQPPFGFGNRVGFATRNASASFDSIQIEDDVPPPPPPR
jgi:pectate lyase